MEDKFNIVKRGYEPSEVNKYIAELEAVIRSYKEKDATIKNAIISAQIAAENIVEKAEARADLIVKDADKEASDIKTGAVRFLDETLDTIVSRKNSLRSFQQEFNEVMQRFSRQFDESEAYRLIASANDAETCFKDIKDSILEQAEGKPMTDGDSDED